MSVLGGNPLLLGSAGSPTDPTFPVQRSVRLRSSASAYFNRTPASTSNRRTFTLSSWVKRGTLGVDSNIFGASSDNFASNYFSIYFGSGNGIRIQNVTAGTANFDCSTTPVYRDTSAWYHVVVAIDTTQATSTERLKLWVNGLQVTAFSPSTYPSLNFDTYVDSNSFAHALGRLSFDGYLTEVNFIDGQALKPSAFGGYNSGTGVWEPRQYTGTYGTNGFYLNFQDNSGATATTIGKDSSGNGNNWTPNNISVTAGVTYDSMLDVPTLTSPTNANFAVMNPLKTYTSNPALTNGNLTASDSNAVVTSAISTMSFGTSGKYYFECTMVAVATANSNYVGVIDATNGFGTAPFQNKGEYRSTGDIYNIAGTLQTTGASYTTNDVIGVAVDVTNGTVQFYKNNVAQGATPSFTFTAGTELWAAISTDNQVGTKTYALNFGQRPFSYTPPTGFKSLNTYNLPEPTIPSGDDYHKVYTYTGNGGGLQVGEIQKPLSLYNLDRSLRFKGTNSYFDKVFASGGANTKGTLSLWVKRGKLGVQQELVRFGTTGTLFSGLFFSASDTLNFVRLNSTYQGFIQPTKVFKDPNAWIHIVVGWDTTQATAADRVKLYINGIQETVLTSATYPTQNLDMYWFTAGTHNIGRYPVGGNYFDGYMAEFHAVDGTMLTASDFGQFDGNYYWTPKDYTGSYGTNGWHLDFEDFSAVTAAAIGKDVSGLGNNFTPYNFNLTTPANTNTSWDSMVDVPTLTNTDVANFAVLSPFDKDTGNTVSNGNLQVVTSTTGQGFQRASLFARTGKWYWEVLVSSNTGNSAIGVAGENTLANTTNYIGATSDSYSYVASNGNKYTNGVNLSYGATYTTNDVIGVALDLDIGTLEFFKNGVSQGTAYSGLSGVFAPAISDVSGSLSSTFIVNFGQRPFKYSNYGTDRPAATFKSLNSFNIAEVTGDLESPDFVWIKSRSAATGHALFNSVTGVGKYLSSNATTAETTDVNSLIQFNKNGFLLGNAAIVNTSAATYAASAWKAGNTTVTNTDGSISAQVKANQINGFSIVTYTGTGTNGATVGHGLGVAPKMIIVKGRAAALSWQVYHASLSANGGVYLDAINGYGASAVFWNNTAPTSSVFSLGTATQVNRNADTYVAYCFSEIAGFSKFGSYTGNGLADGPFIYTGFKPRWILLKRTDTTGNWTIQDTSRTPNNASQSVLYPNVVNAEASSNTMDLLSNGFKFRSTSVEQNGGGATYIYAAFAENPFKYSLAR